MTQNNRIFFFFFLLRISFPLRLCDYVSCGVLAIFFKVVYFVCKTGILLEFLKFESW